MSLFKMFVPITKVDAAKRLVYGIVIDEAPDMVGEVFDYATSKPYFEGWSKNFEKITDGKSVGNLRSMHANIAAGKLTSITFNDEAKAIETVAKVVDDAEWKKVEEGVYTGFSMGGSYIKKWDCTVHKGKKRYTAEPIEVSLVDLPCVPTATFSMVKADGSSELRKFKTVLAPVDNAVVAKRATELAAAAGDPQKWVDHLAPARAELEKAAADAAAAAALAVPVVDPAPAPADPTSAVVQRWVASDGKPFEKKADAIAHDAALAAAKTAAPANAAVDALVAAVGSRGDAPAPAAVPRVKKRHVLTTMGKEAFISAMTKSLSDVGRMASLLQDLEWMRSWLETEAEYRGTETAVPGTLKTIVGDLANVLRAYVVEETEVLVDGPDEMALIELAAQPTAAPLLVAGKTLLLTRAKKDGVGAKIAVAFDAVINKRAPEPTAIGLVEITAQRDALQKAMTDLEARVSAAVDELKKQRTAEVTASEDVMKTITDMAATIKRIEAMPMPGGPMVNLAAAGLAAINKDRDGASGMPGAENLLHKMMADNPEGVAAAFIRMAQQNPLSVMHRGR